MNIDLSGWFNEFCSGRMIKWALIRPDGWMSFNLKDDQMSLNLAWWINGPQSENGPQFQNSAQSDDSSAAGNFENESSSSDGSLTEDHGHYSNEATNADEEDTASHNII